MTRRSIAGHAIVAEPLAPVTATLRAMFGTDAAARSRARSGRRRRAPAGSPPPRSSTAPLPDAARRRRTPLAGAPRTPAAALAWKAYTYWLALPAVLGWASARRVPLLDPADVLMHFDDHARR